MTRDEFISRVKEELMEMIPENLREGLEIQDTMVLKSNDQKHHGLTFKREESEAAPTIYLDEAYARFTCGEELHALTAEIRDAYLQTFSMPEGSFLCLRHCILELLLIPVVMKDGV